MVRSESDDERRAAAAARVIEAATQLHYAAHILGDNDDAARRLRLLADVVHDLGQSLKRG